ncbi:hypothetical protein OH76DRAFT_1398178 [Lentinus brumalis]|uniref:Uncharacterized protein n=1 Tax=Lentinus brumalis TaxID=2498619 RepID=A0A371DQG1_9APHY|nr:hypothetical protein OH76DRAFT_1398178 [Polyporus brumalis]
MATWRNGSAFGFDRHTATINQKVASSTLAVVTLFASTSDSLWSTELRRTRRDLFGRFWSPKLEPGRAEQWKRRRWGIKR